MTGRLIAVVGPSGAGKDTILAEVMAARPGLVRLRRVITRPAEAGGEDFEGVSEAEFARREAAGAFAATWDAHGLRYGIPASVSVDLAAGRVVLFNGSRAALARVRLAFPRIEVIAVTAPPEVLAQRLAARGREAADDIAARLARSTPDLPRDAALVMNDATPAEGAQRFLAALDAGRAETQVTRHRA